MIAVHFDKAFAEQVLDAINTRKPIPTPPDGWTGNHLLMLAGMLHAAVFSQGPHTHQVRGISAAAAKAADAETREAVEQTLFKDIRNGIEFLSQLTFQVIDDEFDDNHEPKVSAVLQQTEDAKLICYRGEGWKGAWEGDAPLVRDIM
jgi:hypothetical protein